METDEQLRSLLTRTPRDVPAFEPRVDQVLRRAGVRRRRRRVGAGAVAVLLVAGVGVPLGMLSGLLGPNKPSPAGTPSLVRPVLDARVNIPAGAVDVTVGDGSVWVSGFGKVSRIDPQTNEIVATIDTPGTEDYSRVAAGEGGIWVTADRGKLYRIDPATNTVVATIAVGGPLIGVVATGEGYVWVTRPTDGAGELVRIDPATNDVVGDPIEVGPGPVSVVSALGALWVTNTSPPSVVRVDPISGEVRTVGSVTGDLAVAYGSLWTASDDQVVRADPETGQPIETFRIPRAAAVATSEGQVWVLAMPESSSPTHFYPIKGTAALWQIDPADNRIVGEPVRIDDLQPIALAAGEGAVWVADYDGGTVTRFGLVAEETEPVVSTWTVHTIGDEGTGISIETPQGWIFREDPLQIDMQPSILFAVGTYSFPLGGGCAPTDALEALPPDGMLLWVSESRGLHPEDFPPRPSHFELDPRSLANYECSGNWQTYLIWFRDGERYFQAQVAFGQTASDSLREEVLRSLDSLLVEPAGLTPDCPTVDAGYAPVVTPNAGPAGSAATVTGVKPPPYQEGGLRVSNWKVEGWWNLDPNGWASFATAPPPANGPGPVVLLGEQSTANTCSYSVRFQVPDVPPGTYTIVVLDYGGGGAGPFQPVTFEVTG